MVRVALMVGFAIGACTPAQAPTARKVGKVMAISGVAGLIATAVANHFTADDLQPFVITFSLASTIGIGMYAAGEAATPAGYSETISERNQRWARILTERAHGYARDGRCWRVRHIETRVRVYDRVLHADVFMQDPEIQKCLISEPPQVLVPPVVPVVDP